MSEQTDEHEEDPRLLAAMQEYVAALEAGKRPDRQELIARHPEIAQELSACLQGLSFLDSVKAQIAPAEEPELETAKPLGDFKLLREIGRGGMGIVYEAVQVSLGRRVAVKVLPFAAALDPRQLQRFNNEAQMAAQLHHTNIVPVYAVGNERGVHFYAMQLIEGRSLAEVIREMRAAGRPAPDETGVADLQKNFARAVAPGGPIGAPDSLVNSFSSLRSNKRPSYFQAVARLGVQAAQALDYAHQLGVVHRDIKPANLLLDHRGTIWITDFGLAQLYADTGLTQPGDVLGTFRYMSPEQASGKAVVLDQRTDVYSLGLTLYELLTLERAVKGETRQELLHHIESVDPPPARSIDPAIPYELETIVAKAMSKEPAERYATAKAMAEDLERYLRDEPIAARPPSIREKSAKWVRRHKSVAFSGVAILLIVTVGLLISTILIAREQSRTRAAYALEQQQRQRADASAAQARAAVGYFARVAAEEFPKEPQLVQIKRDLLETAAGYYQSFLIQNKDNPSLKAELNAAQERVASLLEELSMVDDSLRLEFNVGLLMEDSVRNELKLDDTQRVQISALNDGLNASRPVPAVITQPQGPPAEERQRMTRRTNESNATLAKILSPTQMSRMNQISRQLRGLRAFSDPDVAAALALTNEQKELAQRLENSMHRRGHGPPRHGPDDPGPHDDGPRFDQPPPEKGDAVKQLVQTMSPEQRTKWDSLVGQKFDGTVRMRGPFGGAGGPPMD